MGRIIHLCGKSSAGKDTIYRELLRKEELGLCRIVLYTTRPRRDGEKEGREYFFTDEEGYRKLLAAGKIAEQREYHTVMGLWRYFTVDDGQIDLGHKDYLMIGTLDSYRSLCEYYGREKVLSVLIDLDDGERLQRALNRERKSEHPAYREMCRRFLADCEDFDEEKIEAAGIRRRFVNDDLSRCLEEIVSYITAEGKAE